MAEPGHDVVWFVAMSLARYAFVMVLASALSLACDRQPSEKSSAPSASSAAKAQAGPSASASAAPESPPKTLAEHATELAQRTLIVDGHIDVPYRLQKGKDKNGKLGEDVSLRTEDGDFDYPRAKAGGLDAPFMSIYVPADYQTSGGAKAFADELIDMVDGIVQANPQKFAKAHSPAQLEKNFSAGKVTLLLGIENGAAIERDLGNVKHFYDRGVRYVTLAHSKDNQIADSSYAKSHKNGGLSPFGEKVVGEMNRVGIMVDVSHVSDQAFEDVMRISKAPVIASHSSCRHFTPGFERNMSDSMIKTLAEKDGVIMINFGSSFVDESARKYFDQLWAKKGSFRRKNGLGREHPKVEAFEALYKKQNPAVYATVSSVADHIDHVKKLVGVEHVGLGSDFDGVGDSLPTGLKDVTGYPNLIRELLQRGYSESDIQKVCSGNLLRVWRAVEKAAQGS